MDKFMNRTAKIIAEVMVRTCIDKLDTKVIVEIEQETVESAYNEGYALGHSEAESDNEAYTQEAVVRAYYEGYDDGLNEAVAAEEAAYSRGFDDGRAEADNEAYTQEDVDNAYNEGYAFGYSEGRSAGYSEGRS